MGTLDLSSTPVAYLSERDWRLSRLIAHIGAIDIPAPKTGFETLVHSIIEQMLSTSVANTMHDRLTRLCSGTISLENIAGLSVEEIKSIGISSKKAECILRISQNITTEDLENLTELDDHEVENWLTSMPGIGPWTASMFLLFHLNRPDILPVADLTFRKSFEWLYGGSVTDQSVRLVVCEPWHPYSSYAARYLYRALDTGLVAAGTANDMLSLGFPT